MEKISDMDWAKHIKMDYAQNLRKGQKKDRTGLSYQNKTFYCVAKYLLIIMSQFDMSTLCIIPQKTVKTAKKL